MSTPSIPMASVVPTEWTFKLAPPMKTGGNLRFANVKTSSGAEFTIRTERCSLPFGLQDNKDAEQGTKKKLEFKVADQATLSAGEAIDAAACAFALKESVSLFGKQLSEEIVASMYRPVITPAKAEGQLSLMRIKVNTAGDNETNFLMKTDSGMRKAEMDEVTKKTEAMAIVKPLLWVAGKQWGVTLTATDVLVFPPVKRGVADAAAFGF